jgi:hypothetical protein
MSATDFSGSNEAAWSWPPFEGLAKGRTWQALSNQLRGRDIGWIMHDRRITVVT